MRFVLVSGIMFVHIRLILGRVRSRLLTVFRTGFASDPARARSGSACRVSIQARGRPVRTGLRERLTDHGVSFGTFCAQSPLLVLFWMLWNRSGTTYGPPFHFTMPILVIATLVASHSLMGRLAPNLLGARTGNRGGTGRIALPTQAGGPASYSPQQR